MAIPTSRTKAAAEIRIDEEKCTGCGLCVSVCKDFGLKLENRKAKPAQNPLFGCIACGHCMAVCPANAIQIHGRTLSPEDLFPMPDKDTAADYDQLFSLLRQRRSIREFENTPVDPSLVEKILNAAVTAPMGLPPSDVNVLVLNSRDKVHAFAKDFCDYLDGMKWFVSKWFLLLMRIFRKKEEYELLENFVKPAFQIFTESMQRGTDIVLYDAPLAMYFYGTPYCDPADPVIAATCAMIAAEALGLGTCMIGSIHPLIQNGKKARQFREKQGIISTSREGLFVIFGHPGVKYSKTIRRTFASVEIK